jgi:cyclic pyranopterin phosphate synthase
LNRPSHVAADGSIAMVDVGGKAVTRRTARASALVRLPPAAADALRQATLPKGDALAAAQIAGILAAKRTGELIPLCHPLAIDAVDVRFSWDEPNVLRIEAQATTSAKTGVEMEALVAASVAALTVYDMCKSVDKGIVVEQVRLLEKTGGKSGDWHA